MSESSREDRIWQIRAAALQGMARFMDGQPAQEVAADALLLAEEFLVACDRRDSAARAKDRAGKGRA